jgi:hypothetical protein
MQLILYIYKYKFIMFMNKLKDFQLKSVVYFL